jgi:hypothetical protein
MCTAGARERELGSRAWKDDRRWRETYAEVRRTSLRTGTVYLSSRFRSLSGEMPTILKFAHSMNPHGVPDGPFFASFELKPSPNWHRHCQKWQGVSRR